MWGIINEIKKSSFWIKNLLWIKILCSPRIYILAMLYFNRDPSRRLISKMPMNTFYATSEICSLKCTTSKSRYGLSSQQDSNNRRDACFEFLNNFRTSWSLKIGSLWGLLVKLNFGYILKMKVIRHQAYSTRRTRIKSNLPCYCYLSVVNKHV